MNNRQEENKIIKIKQRLYEIIFEADTKAGKLFDVCLLAIILLSIFLVILESISSIRMQYGYILRVLEWGITIIFTLEYLARIWVTEKPLKYIFSIYGVIDLLALLPTYLDFFFVGGHNMIVIRALRLLRIFRIFKLSRYIKAARTIASALWSNREKISVFILFVFTMATIIGTVMYLIEGDQSGFDDIPTAIYWAVVTLTTVGYGDLSPSTGIGQFLASVVMVLGYSIIAVPTGMVTATLIGNKKVSNTQVCSRCMYDKHDNDANYCKICGTSLYPNSKKQKDQHENPNSEKFNKKNPENHQ
ncbi:MAG TPA: ion transporter [Bacteroidales bacterium]|nr:ion transporter [Bacteroidales bacterium]